MILLDWKRNPQCNESHNSKQRSSGVGRHYILESSVGNDPTALQLVRRLLPAYQDNPLQIKKRFDLTAIVQR